MFRIQLRAQCLKRRLMHCVAPFAVPLNAQSTIRIWHSLRGRGLRKRSIVFMFVPRLSAPEFIALALSNVVVDAPFRLRYEPLTERSVLRVVLEIVDSI